jgi:hypothetical protein
MCSQNQPDEMSQIGIDIEEGTKNQFKAISIKGKTGIVKHVEGETFLSIGRGWSFTSP